VWRSDREIGLRFLGKATWPPEARPDPIPLDAKLSYSDFRRLLCSALASLSGMPCCDCYPFYLYRGDDRLIEGICISEVCTEPARFFLNPCRYERPPLAAREKTLMTKIVAFLKNESGATAIEYGLIAAGISVAIIAVVNTLGSTLNTKFTSISTQLK
jgi:pilus assembly protein Flp/PilA